jgi:DNA-binding CsgD family transcriptional regulator
MADNRKRGKSVSDAEFRRLWGDRSLTLAEVGSILGISGAAVTSRAECRGLPHRPMGPVPSISDSNLFEQMWNDGVMLVEIAQHFRVSARTVRNHVARLGLSRRPTGRKSNVIHLNDFMQIRLRRALEVAARSEQAQFINAEMVDCVGRHPVGGRHARAVMGGAA